MCQHRTKHVRFGKSCDGEKAQFLQTLETQIPEDEANKEGFEEPFELDLHKHTHVVQ